MSGERGCFFRDGKRRIGESHGESRGHIERDSGWYNNESLLVLPTFYSANVAIPKSFKTFFFSKRKREKKSRPRIARRSRMFLLLFKCKCKSDFFTLLS